MENPVGQRHQLLLPDRPTPRRLTPPTSPGPPRHPRPDPRNLATRKSWYRPADHACATAPHPAAVQGNHVNDHTKSPIHGFRLSGEARDHLADFDDFMRPMRNYFHWEPHCYDIPICWAFRSLLETTDTVNALTDEFGNTVQG